MPSRRIDALIPFRLWAWRKQESMASFAPAPVRAASSMRTRSFAYEARCSAASATNRERYFSRSSDTGSLLSEGLLARRRPAPS
jgi:hypothetical protein